MALKYVCNEDMLVKFTNTLGPPDLVYQGDQPIDAVKIVPTKSTKCKILNKKICTTGVVITFDVVNVCPHISPTHTFVSGSTAVSPVVPTATKVKAEGALVLRVDDSPGAQCIGVWNDPVPNPVVCNCNVVISSAGQSKVKAQ